MEQKIAPGLFGQKHASRDYSDARFWGKNQFNSSFPASLVAYLSSKKMKSVYLCVDKENRIVHRSIAGEELLGIDPLSDNAYYNFEAGFAPFEQYYTGDREKIDLVMLNNQTHASLRGLEVKLTALPDSTTKQLSDDKYSCEIVVRPPTICFLACSICANYDTPNAKNRLKKLLSIVPQINHWEEISEVAVHYAKIEEAVLNVSKDMYKQQTPLMIQPVWKTEGGRMRLSDECLDVFVWSNLATIQMCCNAEKVAGNSISRFQRTIIWLYRMLFDFLIYGQFNYVRIIKNHSYNYANDKAFALSGTKTHRFLSCAELTHPRIGKNEIKNIILGGGQYLLSPERRFDAVIVNSPELFD
jgi:hypothetical protein